MSDSEHVANPEPDQLLRFLVDETRRREDFLNDQLDAVNRKSYYVFTLAASFTGVFLSMKDVLIFGTDSWSVWRVLGMVGYCFFVVGVFFFWKAHSIQVFERVPDPRRLVQEYANLDPEIILSLSQARAQSLVSNSKAVDNIARTVKLQHDFFLLQIAAFFGSILFQGLGY